MKAILSLPLVIAFALVGCQQVQAPSTTDELAETEAVPEADPTPGEMVATGVFRGRSGEPMAQSMVALGTVLRNEEGRAQTIQLGPDVIRTTTDAEGRFEFRDFTPGEYAVVYQPSETSAPLPAVLLITALSGNAESFMPLLENVEIGRDGDYDERTWGTGFRLMKGHTLFNKGRLMSIHNATVQTGSSGPYVEIRQGNLVTVNIDDNCQIELDAWSY